MKIFIAVLAVAVVGVGAYFLTQRLSRNTTDAEKQAAAAATIEQQNATTTGATSDGKMTVIGTSVEKRDITAYHYGSGDTELLFVGGIHGGYEWNTSLVAYEMMSYLESHADAIPKNVRVTVVPVLNPDGLAKVASATGPFTKADISGSESARTAGRFNAHTVDLNRNFDCAWQSKGTWQNKPVSGGSTAFSEPESAAIKAYVEAHKPTAVLIWYSAAGGVFASKCEDGISPETRTLTNLYAKASGYKAYEDFDFYEVTGDMANWLAGQKIPAISILLTSHEEIEWDKNKAGIDALLKHFAK